MMLRKTAIATLLTSLMTSLMACSAGAGLSEVQSTTSQMETVNGIVISNATLEAREEQQLPPGQPPTANRDIGFAAIFVQLENTRNEDVTLNVEKIEIQDAISGQVQIATTTPQTIRLRPLENAVNDFHITNKTGYGRGDRVKARITVQINGETRVIETAPVTITRL